MTSLESSLPLERRLGVKEIEEKNLVYFVYFLYFEFFKFLYTSLRVTPGKNL